MRMIHMFIGGILIISIFLFSRISYGDVIEYENGDRYEGPTRNGVAHGRGIYFAKNYKYVGYFKYGEKCKSGIIYRSGENIDSRGGYRYTNGDYYEGWVYDMLPHGFGILYTKEYVYIGRFKRGVEHGKGKIFYINSKKSKNNCKGKFKYGELIEIIAEMNGEKVSDIIKF